MCKGRFEDGVFLLVDTVFIDGKLVERFLEINFEALHLASERA